MVALTLAHTYLSYFMWWQQPWSWWLYVDEKDILMTLFPRWFLCGTRGEWCRRISCRCLSSSMPIFRIKSPMSFCKMCVFGDPSFSRSCTNGLLNRWRCWLWTPGLAVCSLICQRCRNDFIFTSYLLPTSTSTPGLGAGEADQCGRGHVPLEREAGRRHAALALLTDTGAGYEEVWGNLSGKEKTCRVLSIEHVLCRYSLTSVRGTSRGRWRSWRVEKGVMGKTRLSWSFSQVLVLRLPSLKSLMKSPERGCDTGTATIMALDMLFAGIDTSSHTIAFALYHLAKNPRVQVEYKNSRQETIPISGSTSWGSESQLGTFGNSQEELIWLFALPQGLTF